MDSSQKHPLVVAALAKPGKDILASLTPHKCHLWHMASCIPGEGGELFDAIKKYVLYGKDLDLENVIEEFGDIEFYLEGLRQELGITREQTIQANINKLAKRYESGNYSDAQAQARADKAEQAPIAPQAPLPTLDLPESGVGLAGIANDYTVKATAGEVGRTYIGQPAKTEVPSASRVEVELSIGWIRENPNHFELTWRDFFNKYMRSHDVTCKPSQHYMVLIAVPKQAQTEAAV